MTKVGEDERVVRDVEAPSVTCRSLRMRRCFHVVFVLVVGCQGRAAPISDVEPAVEKPVAPGGTALMASIAKAPPVAMASGPWYDANTYGWLGKAPTSTLVSRFATPAGATRVPLAAGSFGLFLRTLPLAPEGTPVKSYAGGVLHAADHPNVAAVADLDVGTHDLQQCADSVIRLHAEWRWSLGKAEETKYHAGGGLVLAFDGYVKGDRIVVENGAPKFARHAKPQAGSHATYRSWLDEVFGWANTGSLATEAKKVEIADLRPGDFFVMPGAPFGHAVLVLDVASAGGKKQALVGQGFMPAQSFHVLRTNGSAWFAIDEAAGALTTPFWKPFPWSSLRRLD